MEINNKQKMDNNYTVGNDLEKINNTKIELEQKKFLESNLGKTINMAVDAGIRSILPNFIEEQIINIKDNLLKYGLRDGLEKTIEDAINIGKSVTGIFTGKFENIAQMQNVVKSGGLIDGISSLLDSALKKAGQAGKIDKSVINTIKQGKNVILSNVEKNIEKNFNEQYIAIESMNKYINNWKSCFENKDINGMEKEYKKLEKQFKDIAPIENIINEARTIKILHNLIKNQGNNFELSSEQIELANKLGYID